MPAVNESAPPEAIDLAKFRQVLVDHFSGGELRALCFDLGGNYDALRGEGTAEKALQLITWAQRQHRLGDLVEAVQHARPLLAWETMLRSPQDEPAPFKELRYFDVADADLFFGREKLTAELMDCLHYYPFLAVIGASGSGKSSLVRAGLVPAWMKATGATESAVHIFTPTNQPLESVALSLTRNVESVTAAATLIEDMKQNQQSLHLYLRRRVIEGQGETLIVLDQFEELFTLCHDEKARRSFIENLVTAVHLSAAKFLVIS